MKQQDIRITKAIICIEITEYEITHTNYSREGGFAIHRTIQFVVKHFI